jgi:DNA-binding response OmpR family regulator
VKKKPLGQLLVQRGILSPSQLRQALELQRVSGNRLATECRLQGYASEEDLLGVLSSQVGVPGIQISRMCLQLGQLEIVPEQTALKQGILPVRVDGERVFLAMANPTDSAIVGEIAFLANKQIIACVALEGLLRRFIIEAYAARQKGEQEFRGELYQEADPFLTSGAFVCPPEIALVPESLMHPVETQATSATVSGKPARPGSSSEITIELDGGAPGDLVIPILDEVDISVPTASMDDATSQSAKLPTSTVRTHAAEASRSQGTASSAARVLVIDDDAELRRLVSRVLRGKGLVVEEASRGLEALNSIKKSVPDLLLLDAMLPEIHGFDICRKIKSSERYAHIPIIMISSIYRGWRIARDLKDTYGVDAFLEKPFTIDMLSTTVDKVLSSRKRVSQNGRQMEAKAEAHYQEGVRRFQAGDIDGAIESCREGLRSDPLSSKLHYRLGILYLKKKGMIYQALQEFEETVTLDPEMFSALRVLAILYQRKGFKNKAIDMWERALRSSPEEKSREAIRLHLKTII